MRRILASLALACVAVGCGDDGPPDPADSGSGDLRPADEVLAERARESALEGALGVPVAMENGIVVIVQSIELNSDWVAGESWQATHHVNVRAENPTSEDSSAPWFEMLCGDSPDGGSWMASSTYPMGGDLPAGSFVEGQLDLSMPDGDEPGVDRLDCPHVFVELNTGGAFVITFGNEAPPPVYRFAAELPY